MNMIKIPKSVVGPLQRIKKSKIVKEFHYFMKEKQKGNEEKLDRDNVEKRNQ